MSTPFAEAFSRLRKERNLSQRQAAAELHISQALLSHYENGIREPRLEFVARACEYYNVSADYLLGRTGEKENPMMAASLLDGGDPAERSMDSGDIRRLLNAAALLLEIITECSPEAAQAADLYLNAAIYKMMRALGADEMEEFSGAFRLPRRQFVSLCDAAMKLAEADARGSTGSDEFDERRLRCATELREKCPAVFAELEESLRKTDARIAEMFNRE